MKKLCLIVVLFLSSICFGDTWYAQTTANIDAFASFYSTVWNDAANGSGAWMGNGSDSTFLNTLAADDILIANGEVITVNSDVTCGQLTTIIPGGPAGDGLGYFRTISTVTVVIDADIYVDSGTTHTACFYTAHTGGLVTFNGNIFGSSLTIYRYGIRFGSAGAVIINGHVYGGNKTAATGVYAGHVSSNWIFNGVMHWGVNGHAAAPYIGYFPSADSKIQFELDGRYYATGGGNFSISGQKSGGKQ